MSKKHFKKDPISLNLIENDLPVLNETCFGVHKDFNVSCEMNEGRYWQNMNDEHQNCVINAANSGPLTLQQVGDIFSVTRMRICQIEKTAKEILKNNFMREESF